MSCRQEFSLGVLATHPPLWEGLIVSESVTTLLDEALTGWSFARQGFTAETRAIPDDSWDFRPHSNANSVRELVVHILKSGQMMSGELTRVDGDFQRQSVDEHLAEYGSHIPNDGSPEVLRGLLSKTLDEGLARFRAAGEIHMLQRIRQFDGSFATRYSWFHHGVAHEEYHRGQLATYARCLGLVPALTRMIYGEDAT
jgi:uncharacterized damage-inducible protein DinB